MDSLTSWDSGIDCLLDRRPRPALDLPVLLAGDVLTRENLEGGPHVLKEDRKGQRAPPQ